MKKLLFLLSFLFMIHTSFATWEINIDYETSSIETTFDVQAEIEKLVMTEININNEYAVDISNIKEKLENLYPDKSFIFEWNLKWASSQNGPVFMRVFSEKWEKELELNIFEVTDDESEENTQKILFHHTYNILVYEKSFLLIYSDEILSSDINNYIDFSKRDGIFIDTIWPLNKTDIEISSIVNNIKDYKQTLWFKSDFIIVWWSRDFVFNILSNINKDVSISGAAEKYNIVWLSSYNLSILWSYLKNFLANKTWLDKIILLGENSKYLILKQNQISDLITELDANQQDFLNINLTQNDVKNIFFLSKFINNLSNVWYSTNSIYIFLLIPIILTIIIIFKHFIWLSPIWIVIPLFITLLFFKLGFFLTLGLIIFYVILNLVLSVITDRYNLLYAPRMVFLITINIILFIWMINILYGLNVISLNVSDILFFIIFILLSEKMISIITSKDLWEYKESFFYTILVAIFAFGIFNITGIKVFLLSYPEVILFLIPVNFLIWKFSWLRITEYFRFKEIIKSVEEE